MTAPAASYHIGADENGLGPRLGPLVVTAVLARASASGAERLYREPGPALARYLGDSKALVGHGRVALAEAWTRVLVARGAARTTDASSPAALLEAVALDGTAPLRAPCPAPASPQCWSERDEGFNDASEPDPWRAQVEAALDQLAADGIAIMAVRSTIVCTAALNAAARRAESRLLVDLHAMEHLLLALREMAGTPVRAVCGKVGGYASYGPALGPLAGFPRTVVEEGRARSSYRIAGLGELAFVRDAEPDHLLVAMASLVGKYLRELLMGRVARYYQRLDPRLPLVSGYGDVRTTSFMAAAARLRAQQCIALDCFVRSKRQGGRAGGPPRG